ncbi:MAG TPA: DUF1800 domain-containing protein [Planctomycetota bacterium]|nr:DUF1800 domain-containing protein [Planctomycetota bacterium]
MIDLLLMLVPACAPGDPIEWNARAAEHLLNRAGFGARPAEIERAVRVGQAAFVEELLAGYGDDEPFFLDPPERPARAEMAAMGPEARREAQGRYRRGQRELLFQFSGWWIAEMLEGRHPLRERMTLFWHGYFTSSFREVKNAAAMVRQNELYRRHALGRFDQLLREVVRDPAMLAYLDNDQNRKASPNENLARELMELFTLGEGNYTEQDVKEAARALTGWRAREGEAAFFNRRQHDRGRKSVLGVIGNLDADGLVDVLLKQPACPRWVAGKLLAWFEGREPEEARLAEYAAFLKQSEWDLSAFLRKLFLDPQFYSEAVVGTRIAGPVEYLVGSCRRLGLEPPPQLVWLAAGQLGERLFDPPNVKGWEGGAAWVTTSSLLQRGNYAGMLLGVVKLENVLRPDPEMASEMSMDEGDEGMDGMDEGPAEPRERTGGEEGDGPAAARARARLQAAGLGAELGGLRRLGELYRPNLNLSARCLRAGAASDAAILATLCSELLAVELTAPSRAVLTKFLDGERASLGVADGKLLEQQPEAERLLRRIAHLILSLPEAQLH